MAGETCDLRDDSMTLTGFADFSDAGMYLTLHFAILHIAADDTNETL